MSPRSYSSRAVSTPEPLRCQDTVETAVQKVLAAELSALPVVDADGRYAGIFGERSSWRRGSPATSSSSKRPGS